MRGPSGSGRPGSAAVTPLGRAFFAGDARDVAKSLLGKLLVKADGRAARLVEVEAYLGEQDPGSHAFRGPTPRASIMFGPPGRLYVYFSYGAHWCANVVCGPEGVASAVLLRAAQPVAGIDAMRAARSHGQRSLPDRDLCRGPGRLTEAFGIKGEDNGLDLLARSARPRARLVTAPERASASPLGPLPAKPGAALLWLADDGEGPGGPVAATRRVGLASHRGAELPLRYVVLGSPWASPGPASAKASS